MKNENLENRQFHKLQGSLWGISQVSFDMPVFSLARAIAHSLILPFFPSQSKETTLCPNTRA